jgi:hypothetical protein
MLCMLEKEVDKRKIMQQVVVREMGGIDPISDDECQGKASRSLKMELYKWHKVIQIQEVNDAKLES